MTSSFYAVVLDISPLVITIAEIPDLGVNDPSVAPARAANSADGLHRRSRDIHSDFEWKTPHTPRNSKNVPTHKWAAHRVAN